MTECFPGNTRHEQCVSFHDLGKLSKAFQVFIRSLNRSDATTHTLEGAFLYWATHIYDQEENESAFTPENLAVFWTILRHHADLGDFDELARDYLNHEDSILEKHPELFEKLTAIAETADLPISIPDLDDFFDAFDSSYGTFIKDHNLQSYSTYFRIKETFSQLIFADKYEACFKDTFRPPEKAIPGLLLERLQQFTSGKHNDLSDVRTAASNEVVANWKSAQDKKIFIIEAPTGIGKTFMSLRLGLEILHHTDAQKLITALPMTSIIDQTHEEYQHIIDNEHLLKHHYLSSPKPRNNDEDNENEHQRLRKDEFFHHS